MTLRILPEANGETISAALWYDDQRLGVGDEFLVELRVGFDYVKAHASALPRLEGYTGQHESRAIY